jgi:hypothetical protein
MNHFRRMVKELVLRPLFCHFTPVVSSSEFFAAADNFEETAL